MGVAFSWGRPLHVALLQPGNRFSFLFLHLGKAAGRCSSSAATRRNATRAHDSGHLVSTDRYGNLAVSRGEFGIRWRKQLPAISKAMGSHGPRMGTAGLLAAATDPQARSSPRRGGCRTDTFFHVRPGSFSSVGRQPAAKNTLNAGFHSAIARFSRQFSPLGDFLARHADGRSTINESLLGVRCLGMPQ